jgi:prevent-host-death family protein
VREIGAFEAKNKLSALLDLVERGEEVRITRHGKAVARLVADQPGNDPDRARAAAERIRKRAAELRRGSFEWSEWKAYRDEGRK